MGGLKDGWGIDEYTGECVDKGMIGKKEGSIVGSRDDEWTQGKKER